MQAGVTGDDDAARYVGPEGLEGEVVLHRAVELSFLQDVVFVDDPDDPG